VVTELCTLCGLPASYPVTGKNSEVYCCNSCREVAKLLAEEPLEKRLLPQEGVFETATLHLTGMYCPSCAWLIEERLLRTRGVKKAEVNFIHREARLTFDSNLTGTKSLARRIRSLGYKADVSQNNLTGYVTETVKRPIMWI